MPESLNEKYPKPIAPFWSGMVKFTLLAILFVIIFMLANSMVEHRFFRGGWVDNRGTIR
jgi:hypothetical protein